MITFFSWVLWFIICASYFYFFTCRCLVSRRRHSSASRTGTKRNASWLIPCALIKSTATVPTKQQLCDNYPSLYCYPHSKVSFHSTMKHSSSFLDRKRESLYRHSLLCISSMFNRLRFHAYLACLTFLYKNSVLFEHVV